AAEWWRIAAVAGSAAAAHSLGRHHRERGDEPTAEYWLRQAAESGHVLGAYALADLLEHRGEEGAEEWFRSAAERGHREAAYRVARLISTHGADEPALGGASTPPEAAPEAEHAAEQWYRQAAARGH